MCRILTTKLGKHQLRNYPVGAASDRRAQVVLSLFRDRQGTLWVGLANGLYQVRVSNPEAAPEQQQISVENTVDPAKATFWLPDLTVRALAEDRFGTLWVGTERGLARRSQNPANYHPDRDRQPGGAGGGQYAVDR